MKRALLVGLALVLAAGMAQGAQVNTKAGTNALVFDFSGLTNLSLNPYNGGIGIRHYLADDLAIRPGLILGWNQTKNKPTGGTEKKNTITDVGVNVVLEKHMSGAKSVSPYLGAGVQFKYSKTKNEYAPITDSKTTTIGVMGVAGFEWGWTESLTLGGEYSLGFNYSSTKIVNAGDLTGMEIGLGSAQLALSVEW
jgi:outer membrane protein W